MPLILHSTSCSLICVQNTSATVGLVTELLSGHTPRQQLSGLPPGVDPILQAESTQIVQSCIVMFPINLLWSLT